MKRVTVIFGLAFALNLLWENLHSALYSNYMGGVITEFILVRASLFDALLITVLLCPFIYWSLLKDKSWFIIIIGIIVATLNEWYGLGTGRWVYNELMPVLPYIEVGLTPTIQLGVLGYMTYKLEKMMTTSSYTTDHR